MKLLLPFLAAGLIVPAVASAAPAAGSDDIRAIWVTRFEYQTEADVKAIVANCAALGFNTILFQVRGQADAYYRSSIEPWVERQGPAGRTEPSLLSPCRVDRDGAGRPAADVQRLLCLPEPLPARGAGVH